ncbi:MAG: InlB B-repeat-containing protein, partial [Butyrivibrio sp.]|nr:InlB B-repeat-containing protein [Butyrivibrio sp.]
MAKKTLEDPTMKKTGAMILSFMLIFMMTVTNLAGAYHSAAQVYAAEETDGGEDNADDGTSGGDETALTNTALPTGDVTQSGNQVTTITPPQETAPATTFTVTFDANGHGTAPDAVTVTEGSTSPKPDDLTAEGFMFDGWFRDANATVEWNFDTDTVNENITLYAGWTENLPAPTLQSNAEITSSTQGDANTENNNAQEGATTSNAGNTASTAQEGTTTSDAGNTGSNAKDEKTTTPDAGNTAGTEQEGAKPANDKNEEDNNKTTFTVIFDANGHGTAPASVTVEEGDTIPTPKAPEADGFIFTGWYTEPEARNIWNFEKDTV